MPAAAGSGASSGTPRRPKKPKAPILPSSNPALSTPTTKFVPTADISGGRVTEGKSTYGGTNTLSNVRGASTQPQSDNILFSALARLMERNNATQPTMNYTQNYFPSPTLRSRTAYSASDAPSINDDDIAIAGSKTASVGQYDNITPSYGNYAEMVDRENLVENAPNSPTRVWQPEPLTPERSGTEEIRKMIARRLSRRGGQGVVNPASAIKGYEVGPGYDSDFGPRVHPIDGGHRTHTGDDISQPAGTPIYAPVGGVVKGAANTGGAYGNQVILDHGKGEESMYGHMAEISVQPGVKVKKGDLIGFVGSTGYSTGPHLHQEYWQNGQPIDPSQQYNDNDEETINRAVARYLKKNPQMENVASETPPQEAQGGQSGVFGALGQALAPKTPEEYYESRSFYETPGSKNDVLSEASPQAPVQQQAGQLAGNPQLNALMQAIREQESGGDYGVQNGIGARGAYQIMPSNIDGSGGWDMEALGQELTGQEFLASPTLQDKIAKFKLRDYFKNYGAAGAAKAWYAGPGNATLNSDGPQYGGPSVNDYADSVLKLMQKYLPQG